ncbi:SDR family NAD(P)-dependent oxidoreductase [Rhodohalobacter sp. SW132]|uniref:SDR family NAD(P)-dependent oxidoreductase n=1 Tax=Rhodohalobacter sp. SW132 TaxID=2293433 RepID=UPI000E23BABF|nr:SDR family NAD(P)-dependent oxidoreductase [Rhodohalobacter sp. SW132]REL24156.1 SDR family NAD(P)-dependent oxidoreductase [Rhodohalobacter sp. SW132]
MSKKIIIIGATSGIGEELARQCVEKEYHVGGTGRRVERLEDLKKELGNYFSFAEMDVTQFDDAKIQLNKLIEQMGGMDVIVLNAGISNFPASSITAMEQKVIDVNVSGFVQLFGEAFQYFRKQGHGQIVGVSSIASLFGSSRAAPYSSSKAFISTYMQAYRQRCNNISEDITITDVKPGFVESEMIEGKKGLFWVGETKKAVKQMLKDIEKKKSYSYVTRRWRLVAWLIKLTPNWVLDRI